MINLKAFAILTGITIAVSNSQEPSNNSLISTDKLEIKTPETFEEKVQQAAPIYKITPQEAKTLLLKESSHLGMKAYRFEAHVFRRLKAKYKDPNQARMISSSHCAFQIMGFKAEEYGVNWSELYDEDTCIELGLTIFSKAKETCAKNLSKISYKKIIHCAAKKYNGGEDYAQDFTKKMGL